ncbi:MAG: hypothetical protein PVJ87_06240 [Desulfobacterales bacterium]
MVVSRHWFAKTHVQARTQSAKRTALANLPLYFRLKKGLVGGITDNNIGDATAKVQRRGEHHEKIKT